MAATSVKVDTETKRALDALQAELTRMLGRKVSQQELTRALVEEAARDPGRVLAAFEDKWEGLSEAQIRKVLSVKFRSDIETDAGELDELIYGDPHGERRGRPPLRARRRARGARRRRG